MRISNLYGYLILVTFTLWLYFVTIYNTVRTEWVFLTVFIFFVLGSVYAIFKVYSEEIYKKNRSSLQLKAHGIIFLMVFIGALLTYVVHVYLNAGPVLASGFVGVMAAMFVKKYQVPLYCGSFVGMSSPFLLGFFPFILASLLASMIFVLAKDVFNGYGGKLGTIALSGAVVSAIVLGDALESPLPFTLNEQMLIISLSVLAATITYTISIRLKQGPVLASGLIGLIGGAFLPLISIFGVTLAIVVIGASFVGMSSKIRFSDERFIALAGVLFGLIYIYSAPYFVGAGGKLGTIAFASVLSVKGIVMIIDQIPKKSTAC